MIAATVSRIEAAGVSHRHGSISVRERHIDRHAFRGRPSLVGAALAKIAPVLLLLLASVYPVGAQAQAKQLAYSKAQAPRFEQVIALGGDGSDQSPREEWFRMNGELQVRNVNDADMVPFLPPSHLATGDAVIVAPGGGFLGLAFQAEGIDVARALNERGIAAFVLKYRLVDTPADFDRFKSELSSVMSGGEASFRPPPDTPDYALADARLALRYLRAHAGEWGIDPDRIGMMGFSAGAFLTLSAAIDLPAEDRPAFIAPIYPRMDARSLDARTPPAFIAIARDDFLIADGSLGLVHSWLDACRPVEFHLFNDGGHGFGLGRRKSAPSGWIDSFAQWLSLQSEPDRQDIISFNCR